MIVIESAIWMAGVLVVLAPFVAVPFFATVGIERLIRGRRPEAPPGSRTMWSSSLGILTISGLVLFHAPLAIAGVAYTNRPEITPCIPGQPCEGTASLTGVGVILLAIVVGGGLTGLVRGGLVRMSVRRHRWPRLMVWFQAVSGIAVFVWGAPISNPLVVGVGVFGDVVAVGMGSWNRGQR